MSLLQLKCWASRGAIWQVPRVVEAIAFLSEEATVSGGSDDLAAILV